MATSVRYSLLISLIFISFSSAFSQDKTPAALTGVVTSDAEGRMEGVLVTAKPDEGNIRITVISNEQGRYAFPASRLQAGKYSLAIRAVGYELPGPIAVDVAAGKPAHADIKLIKTKDLSAQLTGAEWLMSVPGDEKQKKALRHCNACHSISVPAHSTYDEEGFMSLLPKMQNFFIGQSTYDHPFPPPGTRVIKDLPIDPELAKYVASINLSGGKTTWPYELRTFPRPRGGDTKVIITEYVLARRLSMPHDISIDQQGQIWYSDFRNGTLGRLDPVSGNQKEWTLPILRKGQATTTLYMDVDKQGNPWVLRFYQGCAVTTMDAKTEQFRTFTVPDQYNPPNSQCSQGALGPDGTIWMRDGERFYEFDPQKGYVRSYNQYPPGTKKAVGAPYQDYFGVTDQFNANIRGTGQHVAYGVSVLNNGDPVYCDIAGSTIGVLDPKTDQVSLYPTPTPDAFPRRGEVDVKGRFWFGEWLGDQIGMFDPETKEIKEWKPPTPWPGFYRAAADKNGEVWSGGLTTDYVFRFNPATGRWRQYMMPQLMGEIRDIKIDDTGAQDKVWVSQLHSGIIAKVEPLE